MAIYVILQIMPAIRFLIFSVLLLALDVRFAMAGLSEDQIKSAYVLNFINFAEWPAGATADNNVTLCVVGNNVLGGMLSTLDGSIEGKRKLHVVQYSSADSKLNRCQVVFIGESEQRHFVSIIKSLDAAPVLTISDIEDFAEKGGDIGLRYRDDKIVFEINLVSVQKSRLRLPGQLLLLASYVFGG